MTDKNKATLIGFIAIFLWSSIVGTIKIVSENFGAIGGLALIYSVATVLLFFIVGATKLRQLPRSYLIWGSLLFVLYELCFSLSIGLSHSGRQAIEVSMLNYLWPTLTILAAVLFNNQKANLLIIPGGILPLIGIGWVLGGEQGLDLSVMLNNVKDNPLSYGLALIGSFIWAAYCMVTIKCAKGKNGVTLFFFLTALVLWIKYFIAGENTLIFNFTAVMYLILSAFAIGLGYAAWNYGVLHGNITILAGASYFIPILSASISALLLNTSLSFSFWQGTALVCLGAILCWLATRNSKVRVKKI
ncbi:aromatic amino acid DMT transporter YddG [Orbus sturtevantii]|uniref:aromatic amino acid DMT transporter YddG n=1 Tax=Orbus sturtevantii TaxID=3074109 RepID=UPI00370D841B